MLVAGGDSGALTRLDEDGHGVAVGEAAADGVGVGDSEGVAIANGVEVGVGDCVARGWLRAHAGARRRMVARAVHKAPRKGDSGVRKAPRLGVLSPVLDRDPMAEGRVDGAVTVARKVDRL